MRDRLTLLIAILLLAGVTATAYWYATLLRKPAAVAGPAPGTPDFEAAGLVITQFDLQGRARHKLFAATLLHYADTDDVVATAPRFVTLRPDRPRVEVRAERARIENTGERVHLYERVLLTRDAEGATPPLRLATEYLLALPDYDRYSTNLPVEVQRGAARISADAGMQLDNIARSAQFDGKVRIHLPPPARAR